jgi:hypothetical protein
MTWRPEVSGVALFSLAALLIARDEILKHVLVADFICRRHAVYEEDALEVVVFVLDDATREASELFFLLSAIESLESDLAPVGSSHLCVDAGEREAALFIGGLAPCPLKDLRIDHDSIFALLPRRVHDKDPLAESNLWSGQADAVASVHAREHSRYDLE